MNIQKINYQDFLDLPQFLDVYNIITTTKTFKQISNFLQILSQSLIVETEIYWPHSLTNIFNISLNWNFLFPMFLTKNNQHNQNFKVLLNYLQSIFQESFNQNNFLNNLPPLKSLIHIAIFLLENNKIQIDLTTEIQTIEKLQNNAKIIQKNSFTLHELTHSLPCLMQEKKILLNKNIEEILDILKKQIFKLEINNNTNEITDICNHNLHFSIVSLDHYFRQINHFEKFCSSFMDFIKFAFQNILLEGFIELENQINKIDSKFIENEIFEIELLK